MPNALGGGRPAAGAGGQNGDLSNDEFPALGVQAAGGYPNGSPLAAAAAAATAAEQASAAAALQHQASQREVHRLGMLANVNGSPQAGERRTSGQSQSLNAARGGFGDIDRVSDRNGRLRRARIGGRTVADWRYSRWTSLNPPTELCNESWYTPAVGLAC